MRRAARLGVIMAFFLGAGAPAGEIGFIEDFALADDRAKALETLIPGTEEHWFFLCLHLQHQGKLDEVERALAEWVKQHGHTAHVEEIRNRQALLRYERDPKASLDFIRWRLGLRFDHEREVAGKVPGLPTRLDPGLLDRRALTARALSSYGDLSGFAPPGIDAIPVASLDPNRRRALLARLERPDFPDLPRLVVEDLRHPNARGFGAYPIHARMTLAQLDECRALLPSLRDEAAFVRAYVTNLQPGPDVDWRFDAAAREQYLERLWAFVKGLGPAHTSLKAHVLYHRLEHDRRKGVYDRARFLEYLAIPRPAPYANPDYLRRASAREGVAQIGQRFEDVTLLPTVAGDEPLVRDYLLTLLRDMADWRPFAATVADGYLRAAFAEAKLLAGAGDTERWTALLDDPGRAQELRDRVDIEFAPTSRTWFGPEEPVTLVVDVKNVKTLIVKVFEIDTTGYYRAKGEEIDLNIDLDGLVANQEMTFTYEEPPIRRVRRRLEFPALARRGVFAIELIGNGRSSRALVRKGQLRFVERPGAAGHEFTVLDEKGAKVTGASIFVAGHEHRAGEDGTIVVPYSTKPGPQPIVITKDGFSTLERFRHLGEQYALRAAVHVERESLLRRGRAKAIVRPHLTLNGVPVSLSLLERPTLTIEAMDIGGAPSSKELSGITLTADRDFVHELQVPDDLAKLRFRLAGKVRSLVTGALVDVAGAAEVALNAIDRTDRVDDLHLARTKSGYVLALLGKNGEPKRDRAVAVQLQHREFTQPVDASLQTDAAGRVELGLLEGIEWVQATLPDGHWRKWTLRGDRAALPAVVHGRAGETISIPYVGAATAPTRAAFALFEKRGKGYVADRFDALAIADGFLELRGLPAGSYSLFLKETRREIDVEVAPGERRAGLIVGEMRILEARRRAALQVAAVEAGANAVRVRVKNATPSTRVHVVATRFLPAYEAFDDLVVHVPGPRESRFGKDESFYVSGRDIGDEYRYILERRYAKKFPGNPLARPGLLLNPWAIRKTDTGREDLAEGDAYGSKKGARARGGGAGAEVRFHDAPQAEPAFANLDFLAEPAVVIPNLAPDASGAVAIPRADLGKAQHVHVIAVDIGETVRRSVAIDGLELAPRDLRLRDGLDPARHLSAQRRVSLLEAAAPFEVADVTTSKVEVYDTLRRVHGLFMTLTGNETLAEFSFVLDWPKLSPAEKRQKYSKYACHELSFFVFKKDRAFFEEVVRPYLANKKDKTFLDRWLLGEDLARYLEPWEYGRLNVFERALLAQRIPGEDAVTARETRDALDLIPPDIDAARRLFEAAVAGSALETTDALGVEKARREIEAVRKAEEAERSKRAYEDADRGPMPAAPPAATAPAPEPTPAPPPAPKPTAEAIAELDDQAGEDAWDERKALEGSAGRRRGQRRYFRRVDQTEEWAENDYYRVPIEHQVASLITVNGFWAGFATHAGAGPFLSTRFPEASRSFTEMLLALAVLDLPFEAEAPDTSFEGARMRLRAKTPGVVFHQEILEAAPAREGAPVLVSQNFFRFSDRWRFERGERLEKYVTGELLVGVAYGCQVVLTNPSSSRRKVEVLLQIPRGAVPVNAGFYTRGRDVQLEPYSTATFEYAFYFPAPGEFAHYPVHVSEDGAYLASAAPVTLRVVETPSTVDTSSWDYISQEASPERVLEYLEGANLGRVDLARIAWRMKDRAFFRKTIDLLARRHAYDHTLWSYGLYHDDRAVAREYLKHERAYADYVGPWIESALLAIDPVARHAYQHLEYSPLVNARAHAVGKRRTILNERLSEQYHAFLRVLAYKPALDDADRLAAAYYLLLQDRVEEALRFFGRVDPARIATRIQYDYMRAYLDLFTPERRVAREVATAYRDYPVDRWRKLFLDVLDKLDEAAGKRPTVIDAESRDQTQGALAATEAALDLAVEAKRVTVSYQNLTECRVNYYLMDVELLFSRNPFVEKRGGQFSFVKPNRSEVVRFPEGRAVFSFDLPAEYQSANLMVEVVAGGVRKAVPYLSHSLVVRTVENYGQLRVTHQSSGSPLPQVYVKTYARKRDGSVQFWKDGYTDLRGIFDYASLSGGAIEEVDRFALLVMAEGEGALIAEAAPPKE